MRIGIFVANAGVPLERQDNVSAHAQIPLHCASLLARSGHQVELLVTLARAHYVLPSAAPQDVPVHVVRDGRRRGEIGSQEVPRTTILRTGRQVRDVWRVARELQLDVLQVFPSSTGAALFGGIRRCGFSVPVVCSLLRPLSQRRSLALGYAGLDGLTVPTGYVQDSVRRAGLTAEIVPYSSVRNLHAEARAGAPQRHRVLFWREATTDNGADLCLEAFEELAPRFPEITFTFAVRTNRREVAGLDDAAARVSNIEVHRFPYRPSLGLGDLLAQSLCVCLPFRRQTMYPQMSVVESLAAGVPVVAVRIGDMGEVISHDGSGWLLDTPSAGELSIALERLLRSGRLPKMGAAAQQSEIHRHWAQYPERMTRIYERIISRGRRRAATVSAR